MGILKKKKKRIIIEGTCREDMVLKVDGVMGCAEVCDELLDALCLALQLTAEQSEMPLDLLKNCAISKIEKVKEKE